MGGEALSSMVRFAMADSGNGLICIFEHAVHYLIEHKLGLSAFYPKY